MRRERSDVKILSSTAYDITEYDNVWIVLKGYNEAWAKRIMWSESKQKYILRGKIIKWLIESDGGQHVVRSYPLRGSISFVDHRDWQQYSTSKWDKAREQVILNLHFSWISHIVLDFDSLDWK